MRRLWSFLLGSAVTVGACASDSADQAASTAASTTATEITDQPTPSPSRPPGSDAATTSAAGSLAPSLDVPGLPAIVEEVLAARGLNGAGLVVVDRDRGVVHEQYWGELGPERISLVASSSKVITAGVLLRLQDEGLLDIDAPVAEAVPWGSANPEITVAQLLSNSSGLVGLSPNPAYAPYLCQFLASGTLQECGEAIFTTTADDGDIVAPDTEFDYGGGQWQVAGAVAEAVSGRSWAELIEEIYVEPCGLEALGYNNHFGQLTPGFTYPAEFDGDLGILAPTGNPNMEGGAYVTAGDYAELLLMHLRGGTCDGGQVLSPEAVATMQADRVGTVYGGEVAVGSGDAGFDAGYGLGWWVDRESGQLYDPGAYGSVAWLDPDAGYGAFLVIEAGGDTGLELATRLDSVIGPALEAGDDESGG